MSGLTQDLGAFVSALDFGKIPAAAVDTVKRGFIDCIGVMFAGREEPVVGILREFLSASRAGESTILYDKGKTMAPDAALINAAAAHALDYDDVAIDGHPSVVLVPAVLAEGERLRASGSELIAAYVAGYETWAELAARDADKHHAKGWHPSAVFGAVAAAASMSAGLTANFGSMTKPLQVARAAQGGLVAARLAAKGLTASPDALEHRGGFLNAISPAGRVRVDGALAAGRDWHIVKNGLCVKRYPVCYALHRSIDGLLALGGAWKFDPGKVTEIELSIGKFQAGMLRHSRPQTALDAKFSAEFAAASAVVAGRVGLAELTDEFVRSAPVQALFPRVKITTTDDADPDEPLFARHDAVRVTLADGTVLAGGPVRHALGHARNPIGLDELRDKFEDCVGVALAPRRREALFAQLLELEALPEAAALYRP